MTNDQTSPAVIVLLQARTPEIGELVEACARKEITFDYLCEQVAKRGYKTTSLHEMVTAIEYSIATTNPDNAK